MAEMYVLDWTLILSFSNLILSAAIIIIAFSLLTYILSHNLTSSVARSFGAILLCVMVVFAGDVIVSLVEVPGAATRWLRFQWFGIAFLPAAYLHFSDAVLRTTSSRKRWRRVVVYLGYFLSLAFLFLTIFTRLVVQDSLAPQRITRLVSGPLFWIFAVYFAFATLTGALNILRARRRCLTPTSIRRMTYLSVAFFAPALGVFPYLLATSESMQISPFPVLALAMVGNVGVALMLILMGYSVAYYGVLSPDRVVKASLIHFLLRGPLLGICILVVMLTIPRVERILGLPRDTVLIFAITGAIVLLGVLIDVVTPFLDRLIYRQDESEIAWLQELDKRLLTTTDLRQFLENLLTALCELLRVRTAFIASLAGGQWQLETTTGEQADIRSCLAGCDQGTFFRAGNKARREFLGPTRIEFRRDDGFWLLPLRARSIDATLGILGLKADSKEFTLSEMAGEAIEALIAQAETAMEDRYLQQGIFATLRKIIPEIDRIQRWRGTIRYETAKTLEMIEDSPVYAPDYQTWVKEALTHYWGGPKLSESPLLRLRLVARKLHEHEGNRVNALRSVLADAIEALRPSGQRHLTASEWLLYNILEMRYVQGRRVRDIADALAMSESDLYRKQRVAIEEVARTLATMEQVDSP